MKVYIFEQKLLDYRVPIYNLLTKHIDLTVVFWKNYNSKDFLNSVNKDKLKFKFKGVYIFSFANRVFFPIYNLKLIFQDTPNILIFRGNVRNLLLPIILLIRKILGKKTIVWGQAISRKRGFNPTINFFDFYSLLILKLSDSYILYDLPTKNILSSYVNSNKLFVAKNTIDFKIEEVYYNKYKNKINHIKEELGFTSKINLCFIGRLSERKKIPRLISIFNEFRNHTHDISLWIIGAGPFSKYITEFSDRNSNIHYVGPKYGEEASKYLICSDAMLMPGWMGLAVNHSLFFGLPVFSETTKGSLINHAPEGSYIQNGYNGFLNEENDNIELNINISKFLKNIKFYKKNSRDYALNNLGVENMVSGVINSIKSIQ